MDSDRAGLGSASLHYAQTCDPGDAATVPSDQDGAFEYIERIEPGFRADRYYLVAGGCVWWEFQFDLARQSDPDRSHETRLT